MARACLVCLLLMLVCCRGVPSEPDASIAKGDTQASHLVAPRAESSAHPEPRLRKPMQDCLAPSIAKQADFPTTKRDATIAILDRSTTSTASLHVDPRREGVLLPAYLVSEPHIVLEIGRAMAKPIPDLVVDEKGVSGTLSFHEQPFFCRIPWTAVFAVVDEEMRGAVYPTSIPKDALCAE